VRLPQQGIHADHPLAPRRRSRPDGRSSFR
jgi:hypothetical protein